MVLRFEMTDVRTKQVPIFIHESTTQSYNMKKWQLWIKLYLLQGESPRSRMFTHGSLYWDSKRLVLRPSFGLDLHNGRTADCPQTPQILWVSAVTANLQQRILSGNIVLLYCRASIHVLIGRGTFSFNKSFKTFIIEVCKNLPCKSPLFLAAADFQTASHVISWRCALGLAAWLFTMLTYPLASRCSKDAGKKRHITN